jgi:hypothetical protein
VRVRAMWSVVLVGVLAATAAGAGSGQAASTEAAPAQGAQSVTVRGEFAHIAVEGAGADSVRYAVQGPDKTWWLDGLPAPVPAAGSEVEITGVPRDEHTLAVDTVRVLSTGGLTMATTAAPRSTRILVLRVFWGSKPPAAPTAAVTQQKVIKDSQAWFREVSHGRYSVSGTVTPWLRIARPADCFQSVFEIANQAFAAATQAGYQLSQFGRYVFYEPCSAGGILGYGSIPGSYVWLFNTLGKNVVMHEQGHNLGLPHASSRTCTASGWGAVTWSSRCSLVEYGDNIDAMGNRQPGHYNAFYKSNLGWLSRSTTVTSTRTVTLAPYETSGSGVKAVRLRSGGSTYWLEYRTRTGTDRGMAAGTAGVQIRYQAANGQTQLLDAAPGSTTSWEDFADAHLPAGSSWTTPERVRITVTGQTASAAAVAFRFGAGAPRAPGSPRSVTARGAVNAARITWTRPPDNGAIIRRYRITRLDNGATRTLTTTGGLVTSYLWPDLSPSRTYSFSVRAINQAGTSGATRSRAVRPLTDKPSVVIKSPARGATVSGVVQVRIEASRNPSTRTPLQYASVSFDRGFPTSDYQAPFGPFQWDTRTLRNGLHTIRVTVADSFGRTATAVRTVTVANPARVVTITSPHANATVDGAVEVTYSLTPAAWRWDSAELLIDGNFWASDVIGHPLAFNTSRLTPGAHALRVRAYSSIDGAHTSPAVTIHVPTPTVGITSPTAGAQLSGQVDVGYSLTPSDGEWFSVALFVDDQFWTSTSPGDALSFDTGSFNPGDHMLRVVGTDGNGEYESPEVAVTFT